MKPLGSVLRVLHEGISVHGDADVEDHDLVDVSEPSVERMVSELPGPEGKESSHPANES